MKYFRLFLLLVSSMILVNCSDDNDDGPKGPDTIAEIAASNDSFATLVSALERTGLASVLNGEGSFTVFAPTNEAFDKLGVDLNTLSDEDLTDILLYHVLSVEVASSQISEGITYVSTASAAGPDKSNLSVQIAKGSDGVSLNNTASVTSTDIIASNGVIHVIDEVILPLDVVGHALANENFTELVNALSAADLVPVLQEEGPFTVFAPVDEAFDAISEVVAGLSIEQLTDVLTYHVVSPANVTSGDLSDGQEVEGLSGSKFTIDLSSGVSITDANDNKSNVVLTDIQATNGVIHVIDQVLLP